MQASPAFVYTAIEKPLLPILADMERCGVLVDRAQLGKLSQEFAVVMAREEGGIHALAGKVFNVQSPKQLAEVLFTDMHIDAGKNKKLSTNVDVLEELAEQGHSIARRVLNYRSVAKLRSTYTEALQAQINPKTGRVHTSYNPVGAATGRLSSTDPNLQNIPVRTEDGRKIRSAFIAPAGHVLMSADYSQIELRLLAHLSGSVALRQAFAEGRDIHAFTAAQVFDVPLDAVSKDQRRVAKILNFGLIYGMGAGSVAAQLGIPKTEAQDYVNRFFARYDGVKEYMEANKEFARQHGYVQTLYGRRIHLPDMKSYNGGLRAGAERAAINAPLQGSNADMIKLVMPKIAAALRAANLQARMVMQVHDELILEVPETEIEPVTTLVRNLMETTTALAVPVAVGIGMGPNWDAAH
ncbi:MAG: DNA polymerase [Alphaproteobacteria bacterium]